MIWDFEIFYSYCSYSNKQSDKPFKISYDQISKLRIKNTEHIKLPKITIKL